MPAIFNFQFPICILQSRASTKPSWAKSLNRHEFLKITVALPPGSAMVLSLFCGLDGITARPLEGETALKCLFRVGAGGHNNS
jgi:hypothetical protein